jgi:hypothetical protein
LQTLSPNANDTTFTFTTQIPYNGAYAVTVSQQPAGQNCTITNSSGNAFANVSNVQVGCVASTYTLSATVLGVASGQSLDVWVNGSKQTTLTPSNNNSTASLGTITAGGTYAITLPEGWYATSPTTGVYCTVQNGSGTANANVSNIAIACNAPPSTITLASDGSQNGQSYAGWTLTNPVIVNSQLYYYVGTNNMTTLQTLFNGSGAAAMDATGDPAVVTQGASSNATKLNATNIGTISVAIPTSAQLQNIYCYTNQQKLTTTGCQIGQLGNPPPGWNVTVWSSSAAGAGSHAVVVLAFGGPVTPGDGDSYGVALQVR